MVQKNTKRDVKVEASIEEMIEIMQQRLNNRVFEVEAIEPLLAHEPYLYEDCELNDEVFPCIRYHRNRLYIIFFLKNTEDLVVSLRGFGKISLTSIEKGFVLENKGVGTWKFVILSEKEKPVTK